MKPLHFLLVFLIAFGCAQNQQGEKDATQEGTVNNDLNWLLGSWKRQNEKDSNQTFEHWAKKSTDVYAGTGYTLNDQDTVFKENLRIIRVDGVWNLEVTGVNENPTLFAFTEHSKNSFTCNNDANDFPKTIVYARKGEQLKATISDGEMEVPFLFERIMGNNE